MAFVGKLTAKNKHQLRASIVTNLPSFLSQMISKICKALLSYYILPIGKKNRLFCKNFSLVKGQAYGQKMHTCR